ncbi:sigma-70 family RNA polymerase sigma factor [Kutzneria sp. CA-103260]|uniref:sigma-70 family RNA polymerase sigma factor n=1 Tax=Kutzneria sp. CA-103260 TaxID=2802641 RepID=UPI001BA5A2B3|nr:sigma-70 family RNA polymerase sigma factor [Kutzneria sp. CA-103260]QUQ64377.1 Sigma-70 region 2 [Kutzneria sp. CA-103260]
MTDEVDATRVAAARSGDHRALDDLVTEYLPLVYNIVRRTLSSDADVDDVVQDTMVRVVRGIGGLREPDRFRSWLVAITMNQIREHRRGWQTAVTPQEEFDERPDPNAEFVDRALTELDVSQQRRETEHAARWLHGEDRELLSLWSLECGGHLTRAEVASALRLNAHRVTVRVSRLKNRLEATRMLVRAFSGTPRCPQLVELANEWPGEPNPLWRKRFLRHVDTCRRCRRAGSDLVPVERLLMGMGLAALPSGYAVFVLSHIPGEAQSSVATAQFGRLEDESARQAAQPSGPWQRIADAVVAKPVLVPVGVSAVCATVLAAVVLVPGSQTSVQTVAGASGSTASASSAPSIGATPSGTTSRPAPTTTTSATSSSAPVPHTTTTPPRAQPHLATPTSTSTAPTSPADRVLALMNQARAAAGLPPYRMDTSLIGSATAHNQTMAGGCGLSHQCTGEPGIGDRETAAGVRWGACGENIGDGGPVGNSTDPVAKMALGLTQGMLDEKPPNDGHRQNILSSSFTRVGIVVSRNASGTVWMTQDFAD